MPIRIQVRGVEQVYSFMRRLPKQLNEQIGKKGEQFMKNIQKSAKLRAPRWTGQLAQSIKLESTKNEWKIVVDSPYGYFQEFGFRPHFIQLGTPTRSGFAVADWAASKGMRSSWQGSIFVSKHTPFIAPALEMNITKLPIMLQQGANQAIINARK